MTFPTQALAQATIVGVVRDTSGRPLRTAAVALDPSGIEVRGTRVDAEGRFQFDRVSHGTHTVRVTHIGYRPEDRVIEVSGGSVSIEVRLSPLPVRLDTFVVTVRRTGVIGLVLSRPSSTGIAKATVEVLGTRSRTATTADGRFEIPDLPEGAYAVGIRRDGYVSRVISVVVPDRGAVEIAALLDTIQTDSQRRTENLFRDMVSRVNWRQRNTSAIVAAQELGADPEAMLASTLLYAPSVIAKGLIVHDAFVCIVFVDGKQDNLLRLRDLKVKNIRMIEVYAMNGCATEVKPGITVIRPMGRPGYRVYVWLKH